MRTEAIKRFEILWKIGTLKVRCKARRKGRRVLFRGSGEQISSFLPLFIVSVQQL